MKTILFVSTFIIFNTGVYAALNGEYELSKGPVTVCPSGVIDVKADPKTKERTLIFGSSHSWFMNEKNKSQTTEVVPQGCSYVVDYDYSDSKFTAKTTRSKCPDNKENAVITESLNLSEDKLIYGYESIPSVGKKVSYSCLFNRAK